jgi:hypothetical protein
VRALTLLLQNSNSSRRDRHRLAVAPANSIAAVVALSISCGHRPPHCAPQHADCHHERPVRELHAVPATSTTSPTRLPLS